LRPSQFLTPSVSHNLVHFCARFMLGYWEQHYGKNELGQP
jgi:hypothetical protein